MGFKQEVKYRVIDLLHERWNSKDKKDPRRRPKIMLLDSILDEHFGILIPKSVVPYFARKAGMYGMTFEESLAIGVGFNHPLKFTVLSVHVVTEKDVKKSKAKK
jgi:hypothetical protein